MEGLGGPMQLAISQNAKGDGGSSELLLLRNARLR